jgi:hypothetical protein
VYPHWVATSLILRPGSARSDWAFANRTLRRCILRVLPVCSFKKCSRRDRLRPTCAASRLTRMRFPELALTIARTRRILGSAPTTIFLDYKMGRLNL